MEFRLHADYRPTGDQPAAIEALDRSLAAGHARQTLLGVTGFPALKKSGVVALAWRRGSQALEQRVLGEADQVNHEAPFERGSEARITVDEDARLASPPFVATGLRDDLCNEIGEVQRLSAPHTGITVPGTRRIFMVHEDLVLTTFHATTITDPDEWLRENTLSENENLPDKIVFKCFTNKRLN